MAELSYGQRAGNWLGKAEMVADSSNPSPAAVAALAGLGQAMATMALAEQLHQLVTGPLATLAKVQAPPATVPQHIYDEAISRINVLSADLRTAQDAIRQPGSTEEGKA